MSIDISANRAMIARNRQRRRVREENRKFRNFCMGAIALPAAYAIINSPFVAHREPTYVKPNRAEVQMAEVPKESIDDVVKGVSPEPQEPEKENELSSPRPLLIQKIHQTGLKEEDRIVHTGDYWLAYYKKNPARVAGVNDMLSRTSKLRPRIESASKKHNVPYSLLYALVAQESRGNPRATSPAGAYGPVQLMPDKGVRTFDRDTRGEFSSIDYAAEEFRGRYEIFGNWETAIASWSIGMHGTTSALKVNNTKSIFDIKEGCYITTKGNKKSLYRENLEYPGRIMALAEVVANPKKHGFEIEQRSLPRFRTGYYRAKKSDTLSEIAQKYGVDIETIIEVNPSLRNKDSLAIGTKINMPY